MCKDSANQTEQSKTIDKSVGIAVHYKSIKFNKPTSKAKAFNAGFTFGPSDSVTFFMDKSQQSDEDDNLEESFFAEKQGLDELFLVTGDDYLSDDSVINSDDEGDIELLNSSDGPIKSK